MENKLPILITIFELFLLFIGIICLIPQNQKRYIRSTALVLSTWILITFLDLLYLFDKSAPGFQFTSNLSLIPDYGLNLSFGLDGISFVFVLLTALIIPLCILSCNQSTPNYKRLIVNLLLTELFLLFTFSVTNIFFFYVFFESVLIPMFIIIGVWGSRSRKINAAYYFFLYTLFGSFVLLFGILYLYTIVDSFEYADLYNFNLSTKHQIILFFFFFIPFAIKIPMIPFHLWLPEAHVEAPTTGSVILASLLLKLGGYGFLRFTIPLLPEGCHRFSWFVVTLAGISIAYASYIAMRQTDLKRIIAYSSIAHMNLVVLGLFSFTHQGVQGALYLMIAHGIISAGLFFAVGVLYERHHSRLLTDYAGLYSCMPLFCLFFIIFNLANMSFPGTANFLGEFLIFAGVFEDNSFIMFIGSVGIFLSATYSIALVNRICFGTLKKENEVVNHYADLNRVEYVIFFTLTVGMFVLGFDSSPFTSLTDIAIKSILHKPW